MILCHLLDLIFRKTIPCKDVNLASLLILQYTGPLTTGTSELYDRLGPQLNRNLSIAEPAFGTLKNIICEGYCSRRVKLDLYERDIIEMAT